MSAVRERLAAGTAVVLVSHMLDIVERLCTRVVLVDHGRVRGALDRSQLDAMPGEGRTLEQWFLEQTRPEDDRV